jgi:hypothetical protein
MELRDNQALNGDIASPEVILLTFSEGLTEESRSAIVRDHNIGSYVSRRMESRTWDVWEAGKLISDLLAVIVQERRNHWQRCRETRVAPSNGVVG